MSNLAKRQKFIAELSTPSSASRAVLTQLTDAWLVELAQVAGLSRIDGTLVAVGGYGRGDLSPGSDLDVVLLVDGGADPQSVTKVAEAIWYPIWDAGVALDHSVRTLATARTLAAEDLKVMLGLLDARTIIGNPERTQTLLSAVLGDWRAFAPKRLPELHDMVTQRTHRAGELAHLLEPDLKDSYGGLRELTVLNAIAASWITDVDRNAVAVPSEFLLDVRDALHVVAKRTTDLLVLQEQAEVAEFLGFSSADELLRAVSKSARTISYVSDLSWHRALANIKPKKIGRLTRRTPDQVASERRPLAQGVVLQNGEAVLARDVDPAIDPSILLRAAAAAAQAGVRLSPHAVSKMVISADAIERPWNRQTRDAFVSLLGAGRHTLPIWEALDQHDVFSRLIPEWSLVRSAPQHNPVHRFTVDRHLVETAMAASSYTREVRRPDLLLVGALLHDIGKGQSGDHSAVGAQIVTELAPRLGFDAEDCAILAKLVELHLLLPESATKRDIEDRATVDFVAERVANRDFLDLLAALTLADAAATGPTANSAWRIGLIRDLVARVHERLSGITETAPPDLADLLIDFDSQREVELKCSGDDSVSTLTIKTPDSTGLLSTISAVLSVHKLSVRSAITQTVGSAAISQWLVTPMFGTMPDLVLIEQDIRLAIAGSSVAHERLRKRSVDQLGRDFVTPAPKVRAIKEASERAVVIEVRAHDVPGLLSWISGAISAAGCDIIAAKVATLGSEAVDVFYVVNPDGSLPGPDKITQLSEKIVEAISLRPELI